MGDTCRLALYETISLIYLTPTGNAAACLQILIISIEKKFEQLYLYLLDYSVLLATATSSGNEFHSFDCVLFANVFPCAGSSLVVFIDLGFC